MNNSAVSDSAVLKKIDPPSSTGRKKVIKTDRHGTIIENVANKKNCC